MTFPGHNPHLLRWKRPRSVGKRKPRSRIVTRVVSLQSSDQLRDHDDAYNEAQDLLSEWMGSKLRLEVEDEDDDLLCSDETTSPAPLACTQPPALNYSNLDDLYSHLDEENEESTVDNFLKGLMEQDLLDSGVMDKLVLDVGQIKKKFRDPNVTMEARHQQVRENRARREAARLRQRREKEAQREAREEAKRRDRERETRKKQEERRQDEMVQQEVVRLRRQMEERRGREQLARQREKEKMEVQVVSRSLQSAPALLIQQQRDSERQHREEKIHSMIHMNNLKCLQRHFSAWYSVLLHQRLRMDKAKTLWDWKRKLKAWRGWRAVVWKEQKQREVVRAAEELRIQNRQRQLAEESDRRRLLRRCLSEWQLWCRMEKEQRGLRAQQQETKRKMAALINAASTGKLRAAETPAHRIMMVAAEDPSQPETTEKGDHQRSEPFAPKASSVHHHKTRVSTVPSQPWQVIRAHAKATVAELDEARHRVESGGGVSCVNTAVPPGARFENRHAVQQQIITQQRKLLKVQQEQIARLKEEQNIMSLKQEMEKTAQLAEESIPKDGRPRRHSIDSREQPRRVTGEPESRCAPSRKAVARQKATHPIITAMEVRARERAERRKEVEEVKRKKEEQKLAEMKAAEEQRQREEEEEKRQAAEKRREEKRLEREREKEKQRLLKRQQELLRLARQHYHKTLLLHRVLAPWKSFVQQRRASIELAESHHNRVLLRRCTLSWQQSAREAQSEREAHADQLYQHFLLRRSLSCWKTLKDLRFIQEERADHFYRKHTLRRFLLALLDYVTQERLLEWDRQELAQEHNNRRVLLRCLLAWKQFPSIMHKEKERDERRVKLCRTVAEVLPDFCPPPQ